MSDTNNSDPRADLVARLLLSRIFGQGAEMIQVTLNENGEPSFDDEDSEHSTGQHQCNNSNCVVHHLLNKPSVPSDIPEKNEVKTLIDDRDAEGLRNWCRQDITKVNQTFGSTNLIPLFYALKQQWIEGMEILLNNSASPNFCKAERSLPPIFIAATDNMLLPLFTLIKYNAMIDLEVKTKFCKNPINILEYLCFANGMKSDRKNPIATFNYLTSIIAKSNQYDHLLWKVDGEGKNLLHICAVTDTLPFLVELLHLMKNKDSAKTKQYINMFTKKGYTPLHLAVNHNAALVSVFCSNGANVDTRMPTADASTPSELTQEKTIKTILNAYRMIQRDEQVPPLVETMEDLE